MSKAMFLREKQLERLRHNIEPNETRYSSDEPWLSDYFGPESWCLPSSIEIPDNVTLRLPIEKGPLFDLENTKILFTAFRHLTPLQAADERIWAYLSHVTFWQYMRRRWPVEQYVGSKRFVENVRERYFFMPHKQRALVRNGIARLWWVGYTTHDEARTDPFELTAVLLKTLDVTQSIMERTFSSNRTVTGALLTSMLTSEREGRPFYNRDDVRDLAKYLIQMGGVTVIDVLDSHELEEVIGKRIMEISASPA